MGCDVVQHQTDLQSKFKFASSAFGFNQASKICILVDV